MRSIRLIGRLDIKNSNLIKSINLEGLRIVGEPLKKIEQFYIFLKTIHGIFLNFGRLLPKLQLILFLIFNGVIMEK